MFIVVPHWRLLTCDRASLHVAWPYALGVRAYIKRRRTVAR